MRHALSFDSQQIFKKAGSAGVMAVLIFCIFFSFAGTVHAQEADIMDIPEIEEIELDIPEREIPDPNMPDQTQSAFMRAREAVNAIIRMRSAYDRMSFEDKISEDFPDRLGFLIEVDMASMQEILLDLAFYINKVNETDEVLSVSLTWEKTYLNWDDPNDSMARGVCEFVFEKSPQGLLLKNVIGDNPF